MRLSLEDKMLLSLDHIGNGEYVDNGRFCDEKYGYLLKDTIFDRNGFIIKAKMNGEWVDFRDKK